MGNFTTVFIKSLGILAVLFHSSLGCILIPEEARGKLIFYAHSKEFEAEMQRLSLR